MVPNQKFRTHNAHALGSPPPTTVCPYCPRHFRSRGGRTKHILAHHQAESGSHEPNPSAPPSPIPYSSSHPSSPILSNYTPPHSSNYMPMPPSPFPDYLPPPLDGGVEIATLNLDAEDNLDVAPGMNDPQVPDGP